MKLRDQMDGIYRSLPAEKIPWNLEDPPQLLAGLVREGKIQPCDAVDVGCGAGNYAVWLATQGYRMTGVDFSPAALKLAERLAAGKGVECTFVEADLTEIVERHDDSFDFGYDWEVLHHVFPDHREVFVNNVHRMLRPGATYLSACFSVSDPGFGGEGKYRETQLGTTLYFSSEEEIEKVFAPKFRIQELTTLEVSGKYGPHMVVAALLERR